MNFGGLVIQSAMEFFQQLKDVIDRNLNSNASTEFSSCVYDILLWFAEGGDIERCRRFTIVKIVPAKCFNRPKKIRERILQKQVLT